MMPPWTLSVVLKALLEKPFEPLATMDLRILTLKTVFLVAITTARRSSELSALRMDPPFLNFHKDKVVLRTDPTFLPKVSLAFHVNEDIILPSFFPSPSLPIENTLHMLDVKRAIAFYIHRTSNFRKNQRLFVCYAGTNKGQKVSSQRLSSWVVLAIKLAYELQGIPLMNHVRAHSTRGILTSTALARGVSIPDICRAATWSNPSTFINHYRLDTRARSDCHFRRGVLSAIL